ncbi:MAG: T9SS type A sorting domain-containing protein [Cyclobacteriaceae bacterium]
MKARFIITQLCILFIVTVSAQEAEICGTTIDEETHLRITQQLSELSVSGRLGDQIANAETPNKIAVTAHIVRRADGTGGLTETQLIDAFADMNEYYINAGIEFIIFDEIDYIDSDVYFDFDSNYEDEMAGPRDVKNTINIYFVNDLVSGSTPLCGYAYFPGNQGHEDRILMALSCTVSGTTLPHELGHYFTLYHTHGRTNTGTTDELVNGSNCTTAGDDLCDTSADPNLSGVVDANCVYTGTARDANGELFRPDPANIMSYSRDACQRLFSPQQYERIRNGFLSSRSYLHQKEYLADFSIPTNVGCVSGELSFVDLSRGAVENVLWEFEGGTPSESAELSPTVLYSTPGVYDVTYTVFGSDGDSHSRYVSNAVTIIDYNQTLAEGITEDFESEPAALYTIFSPEDSYSFTQSANGFGSASSISMDFFNYDELDREDYLLFNPIANPGTEDNILSFDYAYTYYAKNGEGEAFDQVEVVYKDCDEWKVLWSTNGKQGATTGPQFKRFIPEQDEWVHVETYLPVPDGSSFIQLAVRTVNGGGNNFYLDNLTVERSTSLILRSISVSREQCSGDQTGQIVAEASFNGQEVQYSLDDVSYSVSGVFENLSAGNYTVHITSGAEKIEETVTVGSINATPPKPFIIFSDDELKLLSIEAEIEWYYNDQLIDDSGSATIAYQGSGNYHVIVRNASGCENVSDPFIILGTKEKLNGIRVYPNPVRDKLNIEFDQSNKVELKMYDLAGNTHKIIADSQNRLMMSHLSPGVYILQILAESEMKSIRIIKE